MLLMVSSFFLASALLVVEVLAKVIVISCEGFHLDAHLSFAQALTLPEIWSAVNSERRFFFWSGICGAFFLCLLSEVGEEVLPNHWEGGARLPLVRVRIVFCDVISPLDPSFTLDSYSPIYIQG